MKLRRTVLSLVAGATLVAAAPAHAVSTGPVQRVWVAMRPSIATEIPPDILAGGQRLSWFLTTENSERCDSQASETAVAGPAVDCQAAGRSVTQTRPDYLDHLPDAMPANRPHRAEYFGVYSAAHARAADGSRYIVEATHGENKNVVRNGLYYQNSVYSGLDGLIPPLGGSCFSGFNPITFVYEDCYAAYTGWIGTATVAENASNNWGLQEPQDLGPAVWPANGYASADGKTMLGHGVRHPMIVSGGDGYLYMWYYDDGILPGNLYQGFRVARAKESDGGRNWKTWDVTRNDWIQSVPTGVGSTVTAAQMALPSPARNSSPLFNSTSTVFAVARVKGRKGFIGVDQGRDWDRPCTGPDGRASYRAFTRIRVSVDGVNWNAPINLHGTGFDDCDFFVTSPITYPRFMNAEGTSTKEVSLDNFNIIGTKYGGAISRIPVSAPELASQLPVSNWSSDDPDRGPVPVQSTGTGGGTGTGQTGTPDTTPDAPNSSPETGPGSAGASPDAAPRASVSVVTAAVTRTKKATVSVKVRRCTTSTSGARIKVLGRWTTVRCNRAGTVKGLVAGRTYTFVTQAVRTDSAKQVLAAGARVRKTVRIPTWRTFVRR